ncbi:hypothetical protein MKZ38_003652 [Zalerion maritima]|uniref:Nuclease S1 n=1 Tax=Zalerion maritima TaxID=339359 RepID=A0AAD5RMH4_9PEZI|nr:hypothetical protein MKZ38_003652 [Zalerion maritima]
MAQKLTNVALLALPALPLAGAWGSMGHYTIAYIATSFVSSDTQAYFQDLLGDTSSDYLANVATWADSWRYTDEGGFSKPFHYIDAMDDPPSSCDVDFERDCPEEGCIVSAIANYTNIMLTPSESTASLEVAAKMLVHFLGDIGQPLHCENLELGGNGIDVTYDGEDTNLHSVWDSDIPESITDGSSQSVARTWASSLVSAIETGGYADLAGDWVEGMDVTESQDQAMIWATESNEYVCTAVLVDGVQHVESTDLAGDYTDDAQPVVKVQVAKQGYRLAKWLDGIVEELSKGKGRSKCKPRGKGEEF